MSWLSWLGSLFTALNKLLDWLMTERFIELGRLREQEAQAQQERKNAAIAAEVDSRPVPDDKLRILDGLLPPDQR